MLMSPRRDRHGRGRRNDHVGAIETSRPDAKKAEEERGTG